jgi:hypothetical protein
MRQVEGCKNFYLIEKRQRKKIVKIIVRALLAVRENPYRQNFHFPQFSPPAFCFFPGALQTAHNPLIVLNFLSL